MKWLTGFIVSLGVVVSSAVFAADGSALFRLDQAGTDVVTGLVRSVSRNTLDIYDEDLKEVKRFIYLDYSSPYRAGDRVRAYYDRSSGRIESIRKMMPTNTSEDGKRKSYDVPN